jgi:predicted nuclease of predicted toxin-antitoxin system
MPRYLIDVNLPYYFSLWRSDQYVQQLDIQNDAEDYAIWQYAQSRNLTIVTKDSDFSDRILLSTPPPRIIHIRTGNISMRDFYTLMNSVWEDVVTLSKEYKLVTVFKDKLEAVN